MLKRKFLLLCVLISSFALATVSWAAPETENAKDVFKQIAAPADDFAMLALPNPAEVGASSHSALIPVTLTPTNDGRWQWSGQLPLDSGHGVSVMVLAPEVGAWDFAVTTADGKSHNLSESLASLPTARRDVTQFGLTAGQFEAEVYTVERMAYGMVDVTLRADQAGQGFLLFGNDSDSLQYTYLSTHNLLVGSQVGLVTYGYVGAKGEVLPEVASEMVDQATAYVTLPDGKEVALAMFDDGQHADGLANDGVWGTWVDLDAVGNYVARVEVAGQTANGRSFLRTSQTTFPAIAQPFTLAHEKISATHTDDRLVFDLPLILPNVLEAINTSEAPAVKVAAEIWARNGQGEMVAVSWIGGMAQPRWEGFGYMLQMSVDGRWLSLADARTDFELRNVRVQDVTTSIPFTTADVLTVDVKGLPANAYMAVESISDDMLMGERPASLPVPANNNPEGGAGLVLSHGYCSNGNQWPSSHFTGEAKFYDLDQNRTHDQFARLLRDFGDATFDSYGIVAHSQGGAASLHLYTYYWSGLDYSSGNRLIQSVGTPYQGTNLAGIIAAIGGLFGIQCGSNFDLTYTGASLWLSGIPSWARSRVYYHTTSFKDRWWAYDYCNIASDLVLSDPDDGVVERAKGQLSGANNMGHKEGWCHVDEFMRDPAQTGDYSRNSVMNANANR